MEGEGGGGGRGVTRSVKQTDRQGRQRALLEVRGNGGGVADNDDVMVIALIISVNLMMMVLRMATAV